MNWYIYSGASASTLVSGSIANNSFGSSSPFSITTTLGSGEYVDFVVVTQSGGCCNRSVGLGLSVSSEAVGFGTPEPASFGLILLGLAGAACGRKAFIRPQTSRAGSEATL